jgi:hypothetical protein
MGTQSKHQDSYPRLEEVSKDGEVCPEGRGHIVALINLTIKEIWDLAYKAGFEDGMSFITKEK